MDTKERWKDTKLQRDIAVAMRALGWSQGKQMTLAAFGVVRPWIKS